MTDEQENDDQSKLLLEWTKNEQQLVRLRGQASDIGHWFALLGSRLKSKPENIVFEGDRTDLQYIERPLLNEVYFELARVKELRDAIRKLSERQKEIRPRLQSYGLLPDQESFTERR